MSAWAAVAPRSLVTSLTTASGSAVEVHTVREASVIALGFCLVAGIVTWLRADMRRGPWFAVVAAFMAADLGLMAGTSSVLTVPSNAVVAGSTSVENYVAAHLTTGGRFAFYDPQDYTSALTTADTGRPDDNVLAGIPSVGGYASIVNESYNSATLTHSQGELNVPRLASGTFAQLDLQDILTTPEYFLVPLTGAPSALGEVTQASEHKGQDAVLPLGDRADFTDSGYSFYPGPRGELLTGGSSRWFFGESLVASRATLLLASGATTARIRFGTVTTSGQTMWGPPVAVAPGARSVGSRLPGASAVSLVVQVISGRLPPHQADVVVGKRTYELDGALSSAVRPGPWRQLGVVDRYTLFVRTHAPASVYALASGHDAPPVVDVLTQSDNAASVRVRSRGPVVVVRDVAWDGGWRASVSSNGGPPVTVPVVKRGLVQQVALPAGSDVVRFSYQPRHWLVASLLSEGAALLLLLLLVDSTRSVDGRVVGAVGLSEPVRSTERVSQGKEKFPVVGPPHVVDHESRRSQFLLDPVGGELGAYFGEDVLAPGESHRDARFAQCNLGGHLSPQAHLDPLVVFVPEGDMRELIGIEVPAQLVVEHMQDVLVELCGHAGRIVVGRHQPADGLSRDRRRGAASRRSTWCSSGRRGSAPAGPGRGCRSCRPRTPPCAVRRWGSRPGAR